MKTKKFPLSALLWAMGFSSFAQPCSQLETQLGMNYLRVDGTRYLFSSATRSTGSGADILRSRFDAEQKRNVKDSLSLIGLDALYRGVWILDFENSQLCLSQDQREDAFLSNGYREIKSKITSQGIQVTLHIRWKPYTFLLDTAYDGTIEMRSDESLQFFNEEHLSYKTLTGTENVYPSKSVTIMDRYYSVDITLSNRKNRIGTGFLRAFNWIIDKHRGKVYARKNTLSLAENGQSPEYRATILQAKLVVSACRGKNSRFSPGDIVQSVNGTEVTRENLLEIAESLKIPASWDYVTTLNRSQ